MSDADEQFVEEVKGTFDLGARLRGRSLRTATVNVYDDEVTAEKIQELDLALQQLTDLPTALTTVGDLAEKLGVAGVKEALRKITEAGVRDMDEYNRLEAERNELTEKLKESRMSIALQALPQIVIKDCRRIAKKTLGIKGNIPEDRVEEFSDETTAIALSKAITSITNTDGEVIAKVSVENARDLISYLPAAQFGKIDEKLADLGYRDVISGTITDDADF